jgi:hypothetical protein
MSDATHTEWFKKGESNFALRLLVHLQRGICEGKDYKDIVKLIETSVSAFGDDLVITEKGVKNGNS